MVVLSVTLEWGSVAVVTTAVLGAFGVVGIVYRFVLLPNLREELIKPVKQTNLELTGGLREPSVREKLSELAETVERVEDAQSNSSQEVTAIALMFDGHLEWSEEEVARIQAQVDLLWEELGRTRGADKRPGIARHKREDDTP